MCVCAFVHVCVCVCVTPRAALQIIRRRARSFIWPGLASATRPQRCLKRRSPANHVANPTPASEWVAAQVAEAEADGWGAGAEIMPDNGLHFIPYLVTLGY